MTRTTLKEGFAPTGAPLLYTTEHDEDPAVAATYYHESSGWTWYLLEYDLNEDLAFGLVSGFELELGYFSLSEIAENGAVRVANGPMKTLSQARAANTLPPPCERCGSDHLLADVCACCGYCRVCEEVRGDCLCEVPGAMRFALAVIQSLRDS